MNYIAIYEDPFDENGTSAEGIAVTCTVTLKVNTNTAMSEEAVKQVLRSYLTERWHTGEIKEEKIRIEQAF
jgi:hypothetical protein